MADDVLIFGEATEEKRLAPITAELLGAARRLSADGGGGPVVCALLGAGVAPLAGEAIAFGADRVIVVDDPILADYQSDAYLPVAERLCKQAEPGVVLMGQTMLGRDLAPRLAARLGTAVAMDCIDLAIEGGRLVVTRPCYGGSARAQCSFAASPPMATLRPKAQTPLERRDSPRRVGEVVQEAAGVKPESVRTRILERRREGAKGVRLEDARIVVGGGYGLGGPEGFKALEELAAALDGAVGASRLVCDLGWYPVANQVGLTGKVVTPELYIAVGISGASQHMAGVSQVKNIVAINKDAQAAIFKAARFGIVDDWPPVVAALSQRVREMRGQ